MISKSSFLLVSTLLVAWPASTLLTGCGGGGSLGSSSSSRTFNSALALSNGQIAQLTLNVLDGDDQNGLAGGTLIVPIQGTQNKAARALSFAVPAGSYSLFGSYTKPSAFSVSGTFPNIGRFLISGQIPANQGNGNYTLTAKGETATGSFAGSNATPAPTTGAIPAP